MECETTNLVMDDKNERTRPSKVNEVNALHKESALGPEQTELAHDANSKSISPGCNISR